MLNRHMIAIAAALLALAAPALAGTYLYSGPQGDVLFPGLTPTTIDSMTIGGTTPAAVTGSTLRVDTGTKTASATAGAATLN